MVVDSFLSWGLRSPPTSFQSLRYLG